MLSEVTIVQPIVKYLRHSSDKYGRDIPVPHCAMVTALCIRSKDDSKILTDKDEMVEAITAMAGEEVNTLSTHLLSDALTSLEFSSNYLMVSDIINLEFVTTNGLQLKGGAKSPEALELMKQLNGLARIDFSNAFTKLKLDAFVDQMKSLIARLESDICVKGLAEDRVRVDRCSMMLEEISSINVPVDSEFIRNFSNDFNNARESLLKRATELGILNPFNSREYEEVYNSGKLNKDERELLSMIHSQFSSYSMLFRHGVLIDETNRMKTRYRISQSSGRCSNTEPAISGIAKEYRMAIKAPDGYSIVAVDMDNLEAKTAASVFNSSSLLADCTRADLYAFLGEAMFTDKVEYIPEDLVKGRKLAKGIFLAYLYGQNAKGCARSFDISKADAYRLHGFLRKRYGDLEAKAAEMIADAKRKCRAVSNKGFTRFIPKFRDRYLDNSIRNFFIQAAAAESFLSAVEKVHEGLRELDANIILLHHDSIVVEAHDTIRDEVAQLVKDIMENQYNSDFEKEFFTATVEIGKTWS